MEYVNRSSVHDTGRPIGPVDQTWSLGEKSGANGPELSPGSSPMRVVLVIDDDPRIVKALQRLFATERNEFRKSPNRTRGHKKTSSPPHNGIVLDLELFDISTREICASLQLNTQDIHILVLAAVVDVAKRNSLREAADAGHLTEPFDKEDLLVQLRAATQRLRGPRRDSPVTFGDIHVDFASLRATKGGKPVVLTALQFKMIRFFLNNPDRVTTREELLSSVWEHDGSVTARAVDNQILKLRQRLEDDPANPVHFCTVYGVGYRFVPVAQPGS